MNPVVIPYIHTKDDGQELRYALRSLRNIKNFNGEVYIIGDKEKWFKNIHHIPARRILHKPYHDQVKKFQQIIAELPDSFICSMDDVYITEKMNIKLYYQGDLPFVGYGLHKRSKVETRGFLLRNDMTTKDFEVHTPIVVDRNRMMRALIMILESNNPNLQWRSIYGNLSRISAELVKDNKTKTYHLGEGKIISTQHFTSELMTKFPRKSRFEA